MTVTKVKRVFSVRLFLVGLSLFIFVANPISSMAASQTGPSYAAMAFGAVAKRFVVAPALFSMLMHSAKGIEVTMQGYTHGCAGVLVSIVNAPPNSGFEFAEASAGEIWGYRDGLKFSAFNLLPGLLEAPPRSYSFSSPRHADSVFEPATAAALSRWVTLNHSITSHTQSVVAGVVAWQILSPHLSFRLDQPYMGAVQEQLDLIRSSNWSYGNKWSLDVMAFGTGNGPFLLSIPVMVPDSGGGEAYIAAGFLCALVGLNRLKCARDVSIQN